jgi:GrpB-like predicted nucleotidyltransferase (UPF0157 family)/GNAT superfamily N-acetyltransferase
MNPKAIEIVPYNPDWPRMFEEEASKIKEVLGSHCLKIEHIGSTAVPGLAGKEDIDILCVIDDLQSSLSLQNVGYTFQGELFPLRYFFSKNTAYSKVNLHVAEPDHGSIALHLCFRDYLRTHKDAREAYEALKRQIIKDPASFERQKTGIPKYTSRKNAFIKSILEKAGFDGLTMNFCMHDEEWQAARAFRNKNFFDKIPMVDPYTWTFDHEDHVHLIFYKGAKIIGYAHIQLWKGQRAALRIIVIDEALRNQGLGGQFLKLCERWLKQRGFKVLLTQASPAAHPFYRKYGYSAMPFNDPDGYTSDSQDVDLGKVL